MPYYWENPRHVILDSLNYSEACQVAKLSNTDSFSVFTQKLQAFTKTVKAQNPKANYDAIVKLLVGQGVRFKGAMMNRTMYSMGKSLQDGCDQTVRDELELMEWKYGPELLSSSYNKLGRMIHTCTKTLRVSDRPSI